MTYYDGWSTWCRRAQKGNVFGYSIHNTADLIRTTQEKIVQYVRSKYGKDIVKKLQQGNRDSVSLAYSMSL